MSTIADELTRIQNAKAALATSIAAKGVAVPAATKIDGYAALVDQISQGGSLTAIEGTYTPASDVSSIEVIDARLEGKTVIVAMAYSLDVVSDAVIRGVAMSGGYNPSLVPQGAESLFEYTAVALITRTTTTSDYSTYSGTNINISDGKIVFSSPNRNFASGYTYNWKAYVL